MRFTFCNDLNNHSAILSHQSISPVYSTSSPPQAHWTCPLEAGGSGPPTWPAHSTLQEALTVPKLSPLNLHGNRAKASLRNINSSPPDLKISHQQAILCSNENHCKPQLRAQNLSKTRFGVKVEEGNERI